MAASCHRPSFQASRPSFASGPASLVAPNCREKAPRQASQLCLHGAEGGHLASLSVALIGPTSPAINVHGDCPPASAVRRDARQSVPLLALSKHASPHNPINPAFSICCSDQCSAMDPAYQPGAMSLGLCRLHLLVLMLFVSPSFSSSRLPSCFPRSSVPS
jgi:hypothetical protein